MMTVLSTSHLMRTRDLEAQGFNRVAIGVMVERKELVKRGRGLYSSRDYEPTEHYSLALVAIKYPRAVFCLLTALRLHGITTQNSHDLWIAIENKPRQRVMDFPSLKVVRSTGPELENGNEQMTVDGVVKISVTNLNKTIVECFKFRHKIGLNLATEALKEAWTSKKINMEELHYFAQLMRVDKVMRPYLEVLACSTTPIYEKIENLSQNNVDLPPIESSLYEPLQR